MPQPSKKTEKMNINDERDVRLHKLAELRASGMNPYPATAARDQSIKEALEQPEDTRVSIAGRVMTKREMGKLAFCHVQDESAKMQIVIRQDVVSNESFKLFNKKVDIGDFIACAGERCVTKTGEQSVMVREWSFLAKAVRPLPDKFHGVVDEEIKLRKRYLDLLFDPETKALFRRKAVFWQSMRSFLLQEKFLEVETPVLETTAGGADANPFVTHHDALDMSVYLRISMGELWQKRLMVGGFEKTFEIGRQFRNEGISREHLQDYTQMEFYWAFADYRKGMELVERMYKYVVQETYGSLQIKEIGNFTDIDLAQPWKEIDYVETIEQITGVNVLAATEQQLQQKLEELDVRYESHEGKARLMDSLWKYCRKQVKGPVFLVRLPVDVSPLAKRAQDNPELTERYQVIIAGTELGNGYSELNDPVDQMHRFQEQARLREAGDAEAQMYDADFVEALEYGMPPTTGFGVSERLFSFLENKPIRECVLFPLMRPERPVDV